MDILLPEYKELLLILKKHDVDFILIGGYAVNYYGYERPTFDMDIWVRPNNETREKLRNGLEEFGIEEEGLAYIENLDFAQPQMLFFGNKPRRIDILTKVSNIDFDTAWAKAKHLPLKDTQIPVLHYEHLVLTKISTSRLKDKADIEELQKIARFRKDKKD